MYTKHNTPELILLLRKEGKATTHTHPKVPENENLLKYHQR